MSEQKNPHYSKKSFAACFPSVVLLFILFSIAHQTVAHTTVQIQRVEPFAFFGNYQSVTINLAENTDVNGYGGFSFCIQYDTAFLSYVSVQPDSLFIACNWGTVTATQPSPGLIRVHGTAGNNPSCDFAGQNGPVCRIRFRVTNRLSLAYEETPVRFYWETCTDNHLTVANDTILLVVDSVKQDANASTLPPPDSLPSVAGLPSTCLPAFGDSQLVPAVTFIGERVEMQNDEPLPKGDVNLNGIINEPEDRNTLANYYFYGTIALFDPQFQIPNTDVNGDGIAVTLLDVAFFQRLILADTVPVLLHETDSPLVMPPPSPDTAILYHNIAQRKFTLSYPDRLLLFFIGTSRATVPYSAIHFSQPTALCQDTNRNVPNPTAFVFADTISGFTSGEFLTYTGPTDVIGIAGSAIDFHQRYVTVRVIKTGFCGDFNASGTISITDITYMVSYLFNGGPAPNAVGAGDINCNGTTTITDLLTLVRYLFDQGTAPCCTAN